MNTELPKLIGSAKQVAWAEDIRESAIASMRRRDTTGCAEGNWKVVPDQERRALAARITTARWWIDHRDENMTLELLQAGAKEDSATADEEQDAVETRARRTREWNQYQHDLRFGTAKQYDIDSKLVF